MTPINYMNSWKAEWMKSMSRPIKALIAACVIVITASVFIVSYMDVYNRVEFNTNPWDRYLIGGMAIYVLFVLPFFLILLIGATSYIEEKASGWKFMYTLNVGRHQTYITKLFIAISLVLLTSLILSALLVLSGYVLDLILPEYELAYYTPSYSYLLETSLRASISCLGAISLQFMIAIMTKSVILSMGIGILGYIVGFILVFSDTSTVLYNPYSLVMIDQDFGAADSTYKEYIVEGLFTNVEAYSLFFFALFLGIGVLYESRRNVK